MDLCLYSIKYYYLQPSSLVLFQSHGQGREGGLRVRLQGPREGRGDPQAAGGTRP